MTSPPLVHAVREFGQFPTYEQAREEFTRQYLTQLLTLTRGNVSQAARVANRNRSDFYTLLAKHAVHPATFRCR